jgi:hypothetical protein
VHTALAEAAKTITGKPATYMTYPNGGPVLPANYRRPPTPKTVLHLDAVMLAGYGELRVPLHLWRAFQRFACWVEPALV